ncbi:hypothetical protein MX652_16095, partial [Thauera aromatica]
MGAGIRAAESRASALVRPAQAQLFSLEEAGCYHDTARQGFFSLLMATGGGGGKKQDSYRLSQMPVVLSMLDHSRDTWLSQAEFIKPNRRVVNLARIGLLFADLDTYREPWAHLTLTPPSNTSRRKARSTRHPARHRKRPCIYAGVGLS